MPFFEPDEGVKLHYEVHTPLDLSRPVLLLLHPTSLDGSFLEPQTSDDRLRSIATLITVDDRYCGQSAAPFQAAFDTWAQAADLAKLIRHLGLPPVHVFCSQSGATRQAVRLSVVFPELVKTLSIAGIVVDILQTPTKGNSFFDTFSSLATASSDAELDAAVSRWCSYFVGDEEDHDAPPEVRQRLFTYIRQRYSPERPEQLVSACQAVFNRHPVPRELILGMGKPTLLFWGTENAGCPAMVAISMSHRYKSKDGSPAQLQIIDGAPNLLCFSHPEPVNARLATFLTENHDAAQKPVPRGDDKAFFLAALTRLAEILDEPELEIGKRDPLISLSFSALAPEKVNEIETLREQWVQARSGGGAARSSSAA